MSGPAEERTERRRAGGGRSWARGTIRVRLTVLYSGLFLLTSTILLVTTNLLLNGVLRSKVTAITESVGLGPGAGGDVGFSTQAAPGGAGAGTGVPDTVVAAGTGSSAAAMPGPQVLGPGSGSGSGLAGTVVPPDAATSGASPSGRYAGRLQVVSGLPDAVAHYQWTVALITVGALTVVSVAAGWWLAGRLLRPLHRITATAHRLSLSNLHERIALAGPHDELRELADTFDAMLARLERSVEAERRFIANAAHELRTPLTVQRAAIQIGLTDPAPDRLPRVRGQLLTANQRMERLIDALLMLAQTERGLRRTEPVDLAALVHQAVREVPELPAADVELTVATDAADGAAGAAEGAAGAAETGGPGTVIRTAGAAIVYGDPVLLARLVGNLLDNAVRHNHPGGFVDVRLSAYGTLTVRNSGPEVPEDRIAEIFEPFRRLGAPRTGSASGSGLGLSLVRSIAAAHHLALSAAPNPGGGLIVTVVFPGSTPNLPRPPAKALDRHDRYALQ
ncbi:two-component system, OmpR family, sensor histidine kinase VanS [Frankia sp. AiPs1]|uniref:sensor histidine kinase n=1 Tax=Frankia sp. AiPa1 TaxID=573492 RepID=UPI00202B9B39|nr:HAMP domain-containing sensor histidine kinase [Frankia sp. AiPa1]MCL9758031.1 HAMP domain-containing histidine kinase [Frankia sp. AiPa1]